jgi:hypothetical protein
VDPSVPRDVDESDQPVVIVSAHPTQAVLADLALPVLIEELVTERLGVQGVHRPVVEGTPPLEPVCGIGLLGALPSPSVFFSLYFAPSS